MPEYTTKHRLGMLTRETNIARFMEDRQHETSRSSKANGLVGKHTRNSPAMQGRNADGEE